MKFNVYSMLFVIGLVVMLGDAWLWTVTWPEGRTNTPPEWYFPLQVGAFFTAPFLLGRLSRDRQR